MQLMRKRKRPITIEWATAIINGSFLEGRVLPALKETLIRPMRKKPNLAADEISNYRPIANVSFISKVVERVVADQLQAHLDETDALDPFQSGFRLRHGTETALVALLREAARGKICWSSLTSQRPLIPLTTVSSWGGSPSWE